MQYNMINILQHCWVIDRKCICPVKNPVFPKGSVPEQFEEEDQSESTQPMLIWKTVIKTMVVV